MEIEKFKNKYRIKSARRQGYDYSESGFYFITICTKNREIIFGDIKNEKNILSPIGEIANKCYLEIPNHFLNVKLDYYIIMPNHVHGILQIDNDINADIRRVRVRRDEANCSRRDEACLVSTVVSKKMQKISPKPKSLSVIIGSYKSAITRKSKYINSNFAWQPRFHDRIIRDNDELNRIRQYILDNPVKWELDRNNPNN